MEASTRPLSAAGNAQESTRSLRTSNGATKRKAEPEDTHLPTPLVEMTSNATLCLPRTDSNGDQPYWHVVLGIHNRGKARIMLLSLSVTEKPRGTGGGPANCPTFVSWKEGDLILGEEGSFAGYAVRLPFTGDLTTPSIIYEWNYRFVDESPVALSDSTSKREPVGRSMEESLLGGVKRQRLSADGPSYDNRPSPSVEFNGAPRSKARWWLPWTWSNSQGGGVAARPQPPSLPAAFQSEE